MQLMQCLKHKLVYYPNCRKRIAIPMCNKKKKPCYDWHNEIHHGWEGNFHRWHGGQPKQNRCCKKLIVQEWTHFEKKMRRPGIEPGSTAWKATMLTITPPTLWNLNKKHIHLLLTQLYTSYSQGLSPQGATWKLLFLEIH